MSRGPKSRGRVQHPTTLCVSLGALRVALLKRMAAERQITVSMLVRDLLTSALEKEKR